MLEVRVGRRAVVIEVGPASGPTDALAREGSPFLDHCITEVPTAQHRTQIQLPERVRPGDVPVVVDGCDVVLDATGGLLNECDIVAAVEITLRVSRRYSFLTLVQNPGY